MAPGIARAFELAYFLHRDEAMALRVLVKALVCLGSALARQGKRLYYRPKRRRSKVAPSQAQLLQQLVYRASETHERQHEREAEHQGVPGLEADLIVRFVKHLVLITSERNAFHVSLGVSRLLYGYTTQETIAIYDFVAQDPDCRYGADYCRARKAILLCELRERFGALLDLRRGEHGELSLASQLASHHQVALVHECLGLFTPWGTPCSLAETERSDAPDAELRRIHTLIHPSCFARLTRLVGLDPPEKRLSLPCFHRGERDAATPYGDRRPAPSYRLDPASDALMVELIRSCGLDASLWAV